MGDRTLNSLWMPEILQSCPLGIIQFDDKGRICWANNRMSTYTGLPVAHLLGMDAEDAHEYRLDGLFTESGMVELKPQHRPNAYKLTCQVENLSVANGVVRVAYFTDVTMQYQLENRVESLVLSDSLTGMLNKRGLVREMDTLVSRSRRYQNALSVVQIEFDLLALEGGDEFILQTARQLRSQVRWTDCIGRYADNKFLLLLPETDKVSATTLAQKQVNNLQQLCALMEVKYFCAVATWQSGDDATMLLDRVNKTMLQAKSTLPAAVVAA